MIQEEHIPFDWKNPATWLHAINEYYNDSSRVLLRAVTGEFLVTFLFLFVVMAVGVNFSRTNISTADATLGGVSTAFVAIAAIYSFADVSGAHFNPAVTFGTVVVGKTSGIWYIAVQLLASVCATLWLMLVFPVIDGVKASDLAIVDVGADASLTRAFFMELTLTFILVYVIFATAFETVDTSNKVIVNGKESKVGQNLTIYTTSGDSKSGFAPLAIGLTLGFLCFIGGSVSGGAFNPARAFGPAVITGVWNNHWLYWVGE
ncbi:aquaporin-like protein, partial [Gonapodya prolifera JEL478]